MASLGSEDVSSRPRLHINENSYAAEGSYLSDLEVSSHGDPSMYTAGEAGALEDVVDSAGDSYESAEPASVLFNNGQPIVVDITRDQSDEVWFEHAGVVLAKLPDYRAREAVLSVLYTITLLPKCRRTVEIKNWWIVAAKVVCWIYISRVRRGEADHKRAVRRNAGRTFKRPEADWYLFGGTDCQIGKTFACVVGAIACKKWGLVCFCLTYTAIIHVKDLLAKMEGYMQTTAGPDSTGTPLWQNNTRYHVRAFQDKRGKKWWEEIWDTLPDSCWVLSWNAPHQLDTLAAMRVRLHNASNSDVGRAPVLFMDEWDNTFTATVSVREQQRNSVMGLGRVQPLSQAKYQEAIADMYYVAESLCNIVVTSTPAGFLWALHHRYRKRLAGWAWPPRYQNYVGIEDCSAFHFGADDVNRANNYLTPIFKEKAVEHALTFDHNQIGSVGCPYIGPFVAGSLIKQFFDIRDAVKSRGGVIHACIFYGRGHLYIPFDAVYRDEGVGKQVFTGFVNLAKDYRVKNPSEALQQVRELVGGDTIFCGGTTQTSSRGVSYISTFFSEDDGPDVTCPTTLLNTAVPKLQCCENTIQATARCSADARDALVSVGCVDDEGQARVDICIPKKELDGCKATAKWLQTSYELLGGDDDPITQPTPLDKLFGEERAADEDYMAFFERMATPAKFRPTIKTKRTRDGEAKDGHLRAQALKKWICQGYLDSGGDKVFLFYHDLPQEVADLITGRDRNIISDMKSPRHGFLEAHPRMSGCYKLTQKGIDLALGVCPV